MILSVRGGDGSYRERTCSRSLEPVDLLKKKRTTGRASFVAARRARYPEKFITHGLNQTTAF